MKIADVFGTVITLAQSIGLASKIRDSIKANDTITMLRQNPGTAFTLLKQGIGSLDGQTIEITVNVNLVPKS